MAESPPAPTAGQVLGSTRGSLHIAPRVAERIALEAARRVPGVIATDAMSDVVLRRNLPRVDLDLAGDRAVVQVHVAVAWGRSLTSTARQVQAQVSDELHRLAGVRTDRLSVSIDSIAQAPETKERRVT